MIAANDMDLGALLVLTPDQLRAVLAHASGILAHHTTAQQTAEVLRRVADRIEGRPRDVR